MPIVPILRPPRLELNNRNMVEPTAYPPGFHVSMLNEIPHFDGTPSQLSEYIRSADDILNQFLQPQNPGAYINKLLLSAVRNRLKGQALEIVTGYTFNTWEELKDTLIQNFGDQRSELNLQIDITRMKQNYKESPINFFNRVRSLLAVYNSKISLHNEPQEIKEYKLRASKDLALKAFTTGLLEPLGSFLRCKAPTTLENAISIIREEIDVRYFQNSTRNQSENKTYPVANQFNKPKPPNASGIPNYQNPNNFSQNYSNFQRPINQNFTNQNRSPNFSYNQNPNFTRQLPQQPFRLNPNQPPQRFPEYQRPFGRPGQNVFAPKRNFIPSNQVEPMQTSSIHKRPPSMQTPIANYPKRPNFNNQPYITQSTQPRNFTSQELYHLENNFEATENNDPQNYRNEPYENNQYENQYENQYGHNENDISPDMQFNNSDNYEETLNFDQHLPVSENQDPDFC